ncbi:MAG: tRNA pseudouridine(55) synthase TruB [Chlamydiia bacterium]|nr:tRNA pseudouridine(55) synthase TruB [Chlamydiia bacterium]
MNPHSPALSEGVILIDKPEGKTSFHLVAVLRKLLNVKKIGHAGTLDPFATGVMVMLVGRNFTRLSDKFLTQDKEYVATLKLGEATDSYDREGQVTHTSTTIPTLAEVEEALSKFQGAVEQIPPMFSAKKVGGRKLCDLARQGETIERKPVIVQLKTELLDYTYPHLEIKVSCSKGTYVRSIAHDLGVMLGSYGHLIRLKRTRSGTFRIDECTPLESLTRENIRTHLRRMA